MRRMTTTVLVTMMLMSVFAALLPNELNENPEVADAGRSSGADPMLHDVTEPRESYTDAISGIVRNAMDVGDTTQFKTVIKNDGDALLTDMSINIEVRLTGNDVLPAEVEANDYVICDPLTGCPHENLSAGAWLANGSYTIRNNQGNAIEWTPTAAGSYTVKIEVVSTEDAILTNNEISFEVVVKDWTDISVDICWLDSQGGQCTTEDRASGSDPNHFRVTARSDGSMDWSARGVTVAVTFSGSYAADTSSIDDGTGAQVPVSSLTNGQQLSTMGDSATAEIWRNITAGPDSPSDFVDPSGGGASPYSNPCTQKENPCNATRQEMTFQTDYSIDGVVTPDTAAASGLAAYTVSASIVSHIQYAMANIDLGINAGNGSQNQTEGESVQIMYEQSANTDDRSYNDHDSIDGTFGVYHDIVMMGVSVGDDKKTSGRIGVGLQWIHASVRHDGSDASNNYEWDMEFTITDDDGVAVSMWSDECLDEENQMQHLQVGGTPPAVVEASACVQFDFQPGDYSVKAEATFNNSASGWTELTTGNNADVGDFDAVNSPPSVTLVMSEIANPPAIVGGNLTFQAQASDIESLAVEDLTITWTRQSAEGEDSEFCESGPGRNLCHVDVTNPTWIGDRKLSVRVCDIHNACASDSMIVSVWNEVIQTNSTDDWSIDYSLVYGGMFYHSVWFTDHVQWTGEELTGLTGSYSSVVAFDLGPGLGLDGENMSTYQSMDPAIVARESLGVTFTGDVANDYSIWYKGATGWTQLTGATKAAAEGGKVSLSWSQDGDLPNRLDTNFAVFEAAEATGNPPATGVVCDGPVALGPAGEMVVKWTYEDATLLQPTEDRIHVTGVGNTTQNLAVTENSTKLIGTDGTSYNISIALHNSNGPNPVLCTRSGVVADASVTPHPTVSNMAVTMSANDVSLSWNATDGDVAKWKVCWAAFEFDSIDSLSCSETTDATTSATLAKSTVCGQTCSGVYYFAAAPVDDVGNDGSGASQAFLDLSETVDAPPPTNTGDGVEAGGGFPKLAIYMIAGVVITAVIVGAVIVTRGGGGEGDDFDY